MCLLSSSGMAWGTLLCSRSGFAYTAASRKLRGPSLTMHDEEARYDKSGHALKNYYQASDLRWSHCNGFRTEPRYSVRQNPAQG